MADKKKMSVADILAAARKSDQKGDAEADDAASSPPADATQSESPDDVSAGAAAPAKSPAPPKSSKPSQPGERPSVADILAAARSGKSAGGATTPTAKKPVAEKPAAKSAPKPAAKEKPAAAAAVPAEDLHTASILSGERPAHQHGPMSKSEAAAQAPAVSATSTAVVAPPPMPEKPAYVKPKARPAAKVDAGRRTTLISIAVGSFLATGFSAMAATFGLWTLGLARFMFPNVLREPPSKFKVGFPDDFPAGQVATKFKAQYGVWIVNYEYNGQPEIYALKSVCTHLGCTPNWLEAEQKFKCPCHGSGFYKDGINFEGPAPRPLERYAIHLADDGQLEIDKGQTFQEEMGQWRDANCYVPA